MYLYMSDGNDLDQIAPGLNSPLLSLRSQSGQSQESGGGASSSRPAQAQCVLVCQCNHSDGEAPRYTTYRPLHCLISRALWTWPLSINIGTHSIACNLLLHISAMLIHLAAVPTDNPTHHIPLHGVGSLIRPDPVSSLGSISHS